MFRVKICGITNVDDAVISLEAGADAIGLNFYERSPRCLDIAIASEITGVVRTGAQRIGVFVNKSTAAMERLADAVGLSWLQFHGDETPADVAATSNRFNVVRVRRMNDSYQQAVVADIAACRSAGRGPSALMIDAMAPGQYGGSGMTVNWQTLVDHRHWLGPTPLILAGGLTPDNIAEAIRIVRPAAVDVASGVESSPGKKDPAKVRDFVANALGAFAALG